MPLHRTRVGRSPVIDQVYLQLFDLLLSFYLFKTSLQECTE